ncbi:hypothetical protein N7492_010581 [Penicillium capsulatum]|uniref:NmrA-like domain-containing protein n=1 Tax=Penicillium capsulatum TaxID=69766 RepID=A0A9W9LE17_9EURO|nr:hypothetical protein N7492_010581 [Penicillium capsulatum]KAJ6113081.1 hypothetical protein N7512_008405 [Penicillium capsulatum]
MKNYRHPRILLLLIYFALQPSNFPSRAKLLVVLGATGEQRGSVINYVLNDPVLFKEYFLRGISRSTSSPATQAHQERGVEIVAAGAAVPPFDAKAEGEQYIRSLPVKSAFFALGMFMQNFLGNQIPRSVPDQKDTYAIYNFISPDAPIALIDTVHDTGKYLGAMLADLKKYNGEVFLPRDDAVVIPYAQWVSFLPPGYSDSLAAMMRFIDGQGYFGQKTQEEIDWTVQNARGQLTAFEEFVKTHGEELFPQ